MSAGDSFVLKKRYLFWCVAILLSCLFFYKVHGVLLPFYLASFVVVLFNGLVTFFNKKFRIPRAITSGVVTVLFCFFVVYCVYILFNLSFTKASNHVSNIRNNTELINNITVYFSDFLKKFDVENKFNLIAGQFSELIIDYSRYFIKHILNYSGNIVSTIVLVALSPIVMFMMLKDMPLIGKNFYTLLPKKIEKDAKYLFTNIYESVFKYLEGQTITAVVLSCCYSIVLFIVGIEHFLFLGILIGFSSFVPYIGFYSSTAITLFSVYNQFYDVKKMIITLFLLLFMQIIDSGFITPKIVGNKLGVHPLFVIFGVLVFMPLFGFFGVLLALPAIGILGVVARFFVKKYKNSSYYKS